MTEENKILRREALKRIAKALSGIAGIALMHPHAFAGETSMGYNSFYNRSYTSYRSLAIPNKSYSSYFNYQNYLDVKDKTKYHSLAYNSYANYGSYGSYMNWRQGYISYRSYMNYANYASFYMPYPEK